MAQPPPAPAPAAPAAAAAAARLPAFKIREFWGGPTKERPQDETYLQWERHVRNTLEVAGWTQPVAICMVKRSLRGMASDLSQTLANDGYADLDEFCDTMKKLFVSPAHEAVAREQFDRRVQGPKEPIRAYHGMLLNLYLQGHVRQDEAWRYPEQGVAIIVQPPYANAAQQPGSKSVRLIQHFISGLRSEKLRIKIRDAATVEGTEYNDYSEILTRALALQANFDRNEYDQKRLAGYGDARMPAFDYWHRPPSRRPQEDPVPMDINKLGTAWCDLHQVDTHSNQDCVEQRRRRQGYPPTGRGGQERQERRPAEGRGQPMTGARPGADRGPQPRAARPAQARGRTRCNRCTGIGHWEKNCPSDPQVKLDRGRVNALEEEDEQGYGQEPEPEYDDPPEEERPILEVPSDSEEEQDPGNDQERL